MAALAIVNIQQTEADGEINVYYSVGQNTTDHKTGSPTLTISSGVGTFSVAQTATNMGVGDKVTFNTSSVCYISSKTSTTVWNLITATGAACGDVTGATVNSIAHAFASLSAAVGGVTPGAAEPSFLNTSDLTSGNYILNIPVYYDSGADTTAVSINGWTTGANNFIKIYTPYNTSSEVNQTQRHSGKWTENAYSLSVTVNYVETFAINIREYYVRIEGLQVGFSDTGGYSHTGAIGYPVTPNSHAQDVRISNNILRRGSGTNAGYGIYINEYTSEAKIWNNIIYNFTTAGIAINSKNSSYQSYIYNNTIFNNPIGIRLQDVNSRATAKNNLLHLNTLAATGTFNAGTDYNSTNLSSMGYTVTGGGNTHDRLSQTFSFIDESNKDFHLVPSDVGALDYGANLSADSLIAFENDIDGENRVAPWDIGADEYVAAADITPPTVTAFTIPETSASLTVSISSFTATDNTAVTGYLVNESSSAPLSGDVGWVSSAPADYIFSTQGSKILYAWAKDAAGNVSGSVNDSVVITLPDTTSPTIPSSLTATAVSSSQINLSWSASTDSGGSGLVGYVIYRCTTASCVAISQIDVSTTTSYTDLGLLSGTVYGYRLRAYDKVLNYSNYSSTSEATTQAAGTIYVDLTGNDSTCVRNNNSLPCLTFNMAYTIAQGGDSVEVNGGTYGPQTIPSISKGTSVIIFRPALDSEVILDGLSIHSSYLEFQDMRSESYAITPTTYAGVPSDVHHVTLRNTTGKSIFIKGEDILVKGGDYGGFDACLADNSEDIVRIWQQNGIASSRVTFDGVDIHDVTDHNNECADGELGTVGRHVDGMQIFGGHFITVKNSRFYNNATSNILAQPYIDTLNDLIIENNFFQNIMNPGTALLLGDSGHTIGGVNIVRHNTILGYFSSAITGGSVQVYGNVIGTGTCQSNVTYSHNIFHPSSAVCGSSASAGTPSYVGPTPAPQYLNTMPDYHLSSSDTVAVDRGNINEYPVTDIDGQIRYFGNAPDIGADEYVSDLTSPVISAFAIPSTASSLVIEITTFTATDNIQITGYKITESSASPLASDAGWLEDSPSTYTLDSVGTKTLYAWAKDAVGNVSTSLNDSVTITLPTYSIGGTISGLSGTLVLQNNGGDNESISANGSFTFDTELDDEDTYAVTVLTQPSGQTCVVSDGSGTVSSANVTNVSVTCVSGDTTPPGRSEGFPSGSQSSGTTEVTISLTTDEDATCKYGATASTAYGSIASTFTTTSGTAHSQNITGLTNGSSYNYYIRCIDVATNANTNDYTISFSVAELPNSSGFIVLPPNTISNPNNTGLAFTNIKLVFEGPTYYVIKDNKRYGVTNPGILFSYGLEFSDGIPGTPSDNQIPYTENLKPGDGALVKKPNDSTIYLIFDNSKHGFTSEEVFNALGYSFSNVLEVTANELDALPIGTVVADPNMTHPSGTFINQDGTIFRISQGMKFGIPNMDVYNSFNSDNSFAHVVLANAQDRLLPLGSVLNFRLTK